MFDSPGAVCPEKQLIDHARIAEVVDSYQRSRVFGYFGVFLHGVQQHGFYVAGIATVGHAHRDDEACQGAVMRPVDDVVVDKLGVWHDDTDGVAGFDVGSSQPHLRHAAHQAIVQLDDVADVDAALEEKDKS